MTQQGKKYILENRAVITNYGSTIYLVTDYLSLRVPEKAELLLQL